MEADHGIGSSSSLRTSTRTRSTDGDGGLSAGRLDGRPDRPGDPPRTDHRSQICTALTTLGPEPPLIDVWAFGLQTGRVVEAFAHVLAALMVRTPEQLWGRSRGTSSRNAA